MQCIKKRNIFTLFDVYSCEGCSKRSKDEVIYIGRNVIAIYQLFDNCLNLELDKDVLLMDSKKLKLLLKDAIKHQDEILFCILEDFHLDNYYDIFEDIINDDLSIQIVTI